MYIQKDLNIKYSDIYEDNGINKEPYHKYLSRKRGESFIDLKREKSMQSESSRLGGKETQDIALGMLEKHIHS